MTTALALFLLAVLVPVFFGRLGAAPFWMAVQGGALAWTQVSHGGGSEHAWVAAGETLFLRVIVAPYLLGTTLAAGGRERELLPSNLIAWMAAVGVTALAFQLGAPVLAAKDAMTLGVIAATVAVAFLLLATNTSAPGQLFALLCMENAIALFESLLPHSWPLPVHAALSVVYLLSVGVASWLIRRDLPSAEIVGTNGEGRS